MADYKKTEDYMRMQAIYGENKEITGSYDENLAVPCENGTFVGKEADGVLTFKGIPFAKAPVGALRWKAPEAPEKDDRVREAYFFGKSPIQAPWYSERASYYPVSEDCLYLNVWAANNAEERRPVMVFIHGGAYGYGGTSDPLYDGHNFVKAHPEVILVTIAYRVGIMGFVDFSDVDGSEGYEDSCNLGLLDQVQALKWLRTNVAAFGGDPDNITVFGESAGGGSVSLLPIMPAAKGLFRRVIAQSGSVALTYSHKEARPFTEAFMREAGCRNMKDLLALTEEELYQANLPVNEKNIFPVRDGRVIPKDLYAAYERGDSAWVDMMAGSNKDECRYWIGEMGSMAYYAAGIPALFENQLKAFKEEDVRKVREYYRKAEGRPHWRLTEFENDLTFRVPAQKQLQLHAKNGGKAYHYFWTFPSAIKNRGACHAVELSSVFNNPEEEIYTGGNINVTLMKEVQQMWVNFACTGNPSTKHHDWPCYSEDNKQTMMLGEEIFIKDNLLSRRTAIIEKLLKYHINGNYVELDLKIPYIKLLVTAALLACGISVFFIVKLIKKLK